jgi:hydroxyacylglutathione hydrolase
MTLPDDVLVYPAHGAGSACGKSMSKETWDTLGNQKKNNYALRADMSKAEFIKEVTEGLAPPPQYFAKNAKMNKSGYESIDVVMERGAKGLSPKAFEAAANETDALILDVRDKVDFVKGFIPNAIFIGLDGSFAPWVGALIPDLMQPILLITPEGQEEETVKRLARVGYDNTIGYLEGGFDAWVKAGKEVDTIDSINVNSFAATYANDKNIHILDVRKPGEWSGMHIEGSTNFPLDFINNHMGEIDDSKLYFMHCRSGYRSTVAASILKARGFSRMVNVIGTFEEIEQSGIPVTAFVCPSTLKK